jgi:hypothetical protein
MFLIASIQSCATRAILADDLQAMRRTWVSGQSTRGIVQVVAQTRGRVAQSMGVEMHPAGSWGARIDGLR